ncbi:hypothetical protein FRX31_016497, partial [Thalictrum thalictroides]
MPSESIRLRPNVLPVDPIVQIIDRNPHQPNQNFHRENDRQLPEIEVPSVPNHNTELDTNNEIENQGRRNDILIDPLLMAIQAEDPIIITDEVDTNEPNVPVVN